MESVKIGNIRINEEKELEYLTNIYTKMYEDVKYLKSCIDGVTEHNVNLEEIHNTINSFVSDCNNIINCKVNQIALCRNYEELMQKSSMEYNYCYVMKTVWYKGIRFKGLYYKTIEGKWKRC